MKDFTDAIRGIVGCLIGPLLFTVGIMFALMLIAWAGAWVMHAIFSLPWPTNS